MTPPVRRMDDGTVRMRLEDFEVELLRSLPSGVRALLEDPDTDDPVVARLFPRSVIGDDESDEELRGLIFSGLLEDRLAGLDALDAILDRAEREEGDAVVVYLSDEEPELVLGVLNDVRLTLGYRIGIDRLDRDVLDREHPAAPTVAVMDHLAWLQTQLLHVIDPASTGEL